MNKGLRNDMGGFYFIKFIFIVEVLRFYDQFCIINKVYVNLQGLYDIFQYVMVFFL